MILIISSLTQDDHARPVMQAIAQQGGACRLLDLADYPRHLRLAIAWRTPAARPTYALRHTTSDGDLLLEAARVGWWRRPQPMTLHPEVVTEIDRQFAFQEAYQAINGLWLLLDLFWVNHPTRDEEAGRKPYQLQVARAVGLETPATLITSDPAAARAFVEVHGPQRTIYKSFLATAEAWRETRLLRPAEMDLLDSVVYAPVIFQEYIPADLDLRITIMGDEIFASAIDTRTTDYPVDYRINLDQGRVTRYQLPAEVESRLRAFMRQLGLVYGAIDMRLTPDGRYVFLEVNPSGQWRFMEQRTGVAMTDAFARLLIQHDQEGHDPMHDDAPQLERQATLQATHQNRVVPPVHRYVQ